MQCGQHESLIMNQDSVAVQKGRMVHGLRAVYRLRCVVLVMPRMYRIRYGWVVRFLWVLYFIYEGFEKKFDLFLPAHISKYGRP